MQSISYSYWGAFWRPIYQDQVLTTWSEGRQNGLVLNSRLCDVTALQSSKSDIKFNKKATINLLKCLLYFKSILYLISSTQHTQACVFIKITVQNWFFFTSGRYQDREPSEKLGPQFQEQV